MPIRHQFQSLKSDGPDTTLIRPSNWNADLLLYGGNDGDIVTKKAGNSDGQEMVRFTGVTIAAPWGDVPTGWLKCDGAAVSRSTYARLFAVIGTAFGTGDGSTTFNVPDLRGRTIYGVDAGGTRVDNLTSIGASTGSKTIPVASLPAHDHEMEHTHDMQHTHSLGGHVHTVHTHAPDLVNVDDLTGNSVAAGSTQSGTSSGQASGDTGPSAPDETDTSNPSVTSTTGSGAQHLPPVLAMHWFIKT